jgi:hypothetical protein
MEYRIYGLAVYSHSFGRSCEPESQAVMAVRASVATGPRAEFWGGAVFVEALGGPKVAIL